MKIGTDGVLLGAWAAIAQASSILDIGTGTGLLALMAAQRNNLANIHAIEIEEQAYLQAAENITLSKWSQRIQIFHQSIQAYTTNFSLPLYDSIISNPPYFKIEASTNILDQARRQARSTDTLSFDALLDCVQQLLNPLGNFSVILPIKEGKSFAQLAIEKGFYLKRCIEVIPRIGKPSNRLLLELVLSPSECQLGELIIRREGKNNHNYTSEFEQLHKDFLLRL
ncbi:tRNA1(Val) (adenine(37)-N6)-methyltransferase [Aureispira anguillae]|nr:methyltransferase [Aureispira anguillae]